MQNLLNSLIEKNGTVKLNGNMQINKGRGVAKMNLFYDKVFNSKNHINGVFVNYSKTNIIAPGKFWKLVFRYIKNGHKKRIPKKMLPVEVGYNFNGIPSEEFQFSWLGHSSVLVEFEGKRYLFDPVFSNRVSIVTWAGPKKFNFNPINLKNLPKIDMVFISHNHYDHLDKNTIRFLSKTDTKFCVPLAIGKLLKKWGVETTRISEFDWWEENENDSVKFIATPARHYSNRGLFDINRSLWCSWVLIGKKNKIFFSGDSGFMPEFSDIGSKYGPFDVSFIKIGGYGEEWPDTHMNPIEAIEVSKQIITKCLVPIHWASFDLAFHHWCEPVEKLMDSLKNADLNIIIPKIGEVVSNFIDYVNSNWWKDLK